MYIYVIAKYPKRLYKAPTDYTKPRNTIQRHQILDQTQKY